MLIIDVRVLSFLQFPTLCSLLISTLLVSYHTCAQSLALLMILILGLSHWVEQAHVLLVFMYWHDIYVLNTPSFFCSLCHLIDSQD